MRTGSLARTMSAASIAVRPGSGGRVASTVRVAPHDGQFSGASAYVAEHQGQMDAVGSPVAASVDHGRNATARSRRPDAPYRRVRPRRAHSHSIVAGGLELMS